jgi:hypothetical protein
MFLNKNDLHGISKSCADVPIIYPQLWEVVLFVEVLQYLDPQL